MLKGSTQDDRLLKDPLLERCLVMILQEKKEWANKLREQSLILKDFFKLIAEQYSDMLRVQFHSKLKSRYQHFIREKVIKVSHFGDIEGENPEEKHVKEADQIRKTSFISEIFKKTQMNVENETLFQKTEWSPILFQETYQKRVTGSQCLIASAIKSRGNLQTMYKSQLVLSRKRHLVVLVHGYGGSHYDMAAYKNFLSMIIPHSVFLASKANEEMENKKIDQMGRSLADEVKAALNNFSNIGKISFVGHSLGGIISRAALRHLEEFKGLMFTFVSLSSPHLGTVKGSSFLVTAGLFVQNKIKKESVIVELQMNDAKDPRESFLYSLACGDKLHWFNNIILVSSPQDKYVPHGSARVQPYVSKSNSGMIKVLKEMSDQIWKKVGNDMVVRVDVDLRSQER